MGMTISSGMETILLLLVGATAVFLMVRVAARRYRDKPQVWRSQAFLTGVAVVNGGMSSRGEVPDNHVLRVNSSPPPEPEGLRRGPSIPCAASRT